eukprot:755813-Hanusia_phi.AAC.2
MKSFDDGESLADWTDEDEDYFERAKGEREREWRANSRTLDQVVRRICSGMENPSRRQGAMRPAPPA